MLISQEICAAFAKKWRLSGGMSWVGCLPKNLNHKYYTFFATFCYYQTTVTLMQRKIFYDFCILCNCFVSNIITRKILPKERKLSERKRSEKCPLKGRWTRNFTKKKTILVDGFIRCVAIYKIVKNFQMILTF